MTIEQFIAAIMAVLVLASMAALICAWRAERKARKRAELRAEMAARNRDIYAHMAKRLYRESRGAEDRTPPVTCGDSPLGEGACSEAVV